LGRGFWGAGGEGLGWRGGVEGERGGERGQRAGDSRAPLSEIAGRGAAAAWKPQDGGLCGP
jgi:hypothetical protein